MKTKIILISLFLFNLFGNNANAQTIAVTDFATSGLHVTPKIAAKLARLELVKINKYVVMDEADMDEILDPNAMENCYGKNCLIALGEELKMPMILSGSIDGLGNKIVVSLKLINVKDKTIQSALSLEFDNQEIELQRMIGIVLKEMHQITPDLEIKKRLAYRNEIIISNNVGKVNNTGPRMGGAYILPSELSEFFIRKENQGGLAILPATTNLGYQFEGQYIGTESFSALAEIIVNFSGMEQGRFIPSLSLLNGFRFGKQGWELAFGPSFGFRRVSQGIFNSDGDYLTERDFRNQDFNNWIDNGGTSDTYNTLPSSLFSENLDNRGQLKFNANWVMGIGRRFQAGGLNIPLNLYYSFNKYGGSVGLSVGFNVTKSKLNINR